MTAPTLHDLTFDKLVEHMAGLSPTHARTLWGSLYRNAGSRFGTGEIFLPPLRRWLEENPPLLDHPDTAADLHSCDGLTRKFLLRLTDGQTIETVLMGYPGRYTACLSTQAGCAMGCVFCATGQGGFSRHLRPGEIVGQVMHVQRLLHASGHGGLRNLVLMGMGEPLHNYDAVMTALEIISDTRGINIGPSRITISTVGVIPGIERLAREKRPYHLAVSLHGATEDERTALVPVGRRWPLADLIDACRGYCTETGRRIFFEWTLIDGKNDAPAQAERLASLLEGLDAHINLIPLNPTGGYAGEPAEKSRVTSFQKILRDAGFPVTIRQRRGIDIAAGCGQLKAAQSV